MSSKSDFRGGVMNLINATVGAGIVAVPYAIMQCGFYSGVMLLLLLAYAIFESMIILITCGLKTKTKSLEDLCLYLFDEKGFYISAGFMFMYSYGSMVAILVVIGDIVPFCVSRLFGIDMALLDRNMVIVVVATVAILPLSLLRDLASLSAASLFSILSLVILVVFVVVFGYDISIANSTYAHVEDLHFMDSDIMKGIGTLSFHYVCQHSVLLVFHSLKNPTLHNWKSVASISMISVLAMSLVVGVAGGLLFAQSTKSNILNNFPQDHLMMTIARLCMAMNVIFTYPMECFIVRHSTFAIVNRFLYSNGDDVISRKHSSHATLPMSPRKTFDSVPSELDASIRSETSHFLPVIDIEDIPFNGSADEVASCGRQPAMNQNLNSLVSKYHVVVTVVIWVSTVCVAVTFQDVSLVLETSGIVTASVLGYILPALIFFSTNEISMSDTLTSLRLVTPNPLTNVKPRIPLDKEYFLSILLLLFGLLTLCVGLGLQLSAIF